jgi:hypothetical protein
MSLKLPRKKKVFKADALLPPWKKTICMDCNVEKMVLGTIS